MTDKPNTSEQFELPIPKIDIRAGWTSASNAYADTLCVGRHLAQKGLPELPASDDYATHGNAIHAALATRDPSKLEESQLQTYERCLEIESKAIAQFFGDEAADLMTIAEERFWVVIDSAEDGRKLKHSGQVDRIYRSRTKALLLEYKSLPGEHAAASSNEQLRDQTCLMAGALLVTNIGTVVVQPLVSMNPELCIYNADQIKAASALMFDRVRASNRVGGKRTAGEAQCNYCRAKGQCVPYQQFAAGQLPAMVEFVDSPVDTWTNEQCGVFLERVSTAEKWLENAKASIRSRIEKGELPGWKIGEGARKFEVTDMAELAGRCEALGIPNVELLKLCTPNKEALTKQVRTVTKTKGKGLTAEVDKLLNGIVGNERKKGSIERVPQLKQ
jgi:hypothetical protein